MVFAELVNVPKRQRQPIRILSAPNAKEPNKARCGGHEIGPIPRNNQACTELAPTEGSTEVAAGKQGVWDVQVEAGGCSRPSGAGAK